MPGKAPDNVEEKCHCGRPLHYSSPVARLFVESMIAAKGPRIKITARGRSWLVPRHYIALHGVAAVDLDHLGFEEVTNGNANSGTGNDRH